MNSGGGIRFAAATQDDIEWLVSMMRALEDADPGPTPFDGERRKNILATFLTDGSLGRAWLIFDGPQPIGYAVLTLGFSFEYGGRDAFLDEMYLDERYRGKGIGGQAMDFVEARAWEMGVNAVHLLVTRENEPAIRLYRRSGFFLQERRLMTKRLAP